jgi:hypothetical protein
MAKHNNHTNLKDNDGTRRKAKEHEAVGYRKQIDSFQTVARKSINKFKENR